MKKYLSPIVALFALAFAAAAGVLPPDQLLPDDTLVVFTVPDFAKAADLYSSFPQIRLWNDPAMKPFRDKFMDKLKSQFVTSAQHDLGLKLEDYAGLAQGQFTVALVQDGWQGTDAKLPAFLLLLDTKGKSSQLQTNLAGLKKKWVDAGKTIKTEKIRDVDFSVITVSTNDLPESLRKTLGTGQSDGDDSADKPADDSKTTAAASPPIYIGQAESLLIVGNSSKVIEKVLAAMSGGDVRTLSQSPTFTANRDAMFRDAPVYFWANLHSFVDIARHSLEGAGSPELPPAKIFTALGLDGLKTLAVSYQYSPDGVQGNFFIGVPEDSRTGLFKLIVGEAKDCNPPAFVPADAVKFQRWRMDGQKLWDGLRDIVNNISPQGLAGLDFMLASAESKAKEKDPDFDLKKNLFGNLGDDIITYQKPAKGDSLVTLSQPTLYLIGSPHPEQLGGAFNALMALVSPDATPTSRDFLGRKIYSVQMPNPAMAMSTNPVTTPSLSYASSGGYLALSMDAPMLEEYLRSGDSQGKSLRDLPGLAAATEKVVGSGTSLFGYSNDSETMRLLVKVLKNDSNGGLGSLAPLTMMMGVGDSGFKDWIDLSLLPEFDQISKYFSFSVYSGSATPDGLSFKGYVPFPPQAK
jgi:hypothetical protein